MDKKLISQRFRRSVESYEENAPVQKEIAQRLLELLQTFLKEQPRHVLEIGCGTGLLTRKITTLLPSGSLYINDLVEEMCLKAATGSHIPFNRCLPGDIEEMALPRTFSLCVSASTFQWFARPAETFRKLASHLSPEGLLVFSTFGPGNLPELSEFTEKGLSYLSYEELTRLLSPYFDILHFEDDYRKLYFPEPLDILRHLKKTGVNASASSSLWTKGHLRHFTLFYENKFEKNAYPLTYHPLYFVCCKKDTNTPSPCVKMP